MNSSRSLLDTRAVLAAGRVAFAAAVVSALLGVALGCAPGSRDASPKGGAVTTTLASYFDTTGYDDVANGGVKMIPITTPKGTFRVWTHRVGNNPRVKVLLLHGGPACTHEYFETFGSYLPAGGIEYFEYDQLGSAYSDQPDEPTLWTLDRFVDEVEQVRAALHLDESNFVLLGHSWGGLLAMEYAVRHPEHLKALVISNMMSSIPAYNTYAHETLMPAMDPKVLSEILDIERRGEYESPRYMELLVPSFYEQHFMRRPFAEWPEPLLRGFSKINRKIYVPMQGPSEMSAHGLLVNWDRTADLPKIAVPTLVIGARYDTMDPKFMASMAKQLPKGRYVECPNGSHMAMYDDAPAYFGGLMGFLRDLDAGRI
jgi:proline iminopeptidase